MRRILVIEDSDTVRKILTKVIPTRLSMPVDSASNMAQCRQHLKQNGHQAYFAAMVDLHLPDAPNGEVVALTLAAKIPTIVLTANYDETLRTKLLDMGVVDYVIKDSNYAFNYAISLLERLEKNQHIKLLVVDDSTVARRYLVSLLKQHLFQVLEAADGNEALEVLHKHADIKLLLTDYNMPNMDGFQLVRAIRQTVDKMSLAIIGISSASESCLSARFIKQGANDFLAKPFIHEELYCRVNQTLEHMELVEEISNAANKDHMTQVYNRRYLFSQGVALHKQARQGQMTLAAAIIDVDHFKEVNDTYGHEAGDLVLKQLSKMLLTCFPNCLVARLGGEEFCVLMPNHDNALATGRLDKFRESLAQHPTHCHNEDVWISASIGVTNFIDESLDKQLNRADKLLYEAKETGRNRVLNDGDVCF